MSLRIGGNLHFIEKPWVMGVLNLTSDSFFAGSRLENMVAADQKAQQMINEGANILDLGAQSTRPGSTRHSAEEELEKLLPVIDKLKRNFPEVILSVDTYHSKVAKKCVEAGAGMINDISGGEMDPEMIPAVAGLHVPYICMHMKGVPETMQKHAQYQDIVRELLDFFIMKIEECKTAGIIDMLIDPGFGFGKRSIHNFTLLKNLSLFRILNKPIVAGLSRKSTIYKTLHVSPEDSLNGTTVLNTVALLNGASVLRVHDVKEAKQAVMLIECYKNI